MPIPFVIDNQQHRMADTLNDLLAQSVGKPLDIGTAYFAISGYRLVKAGLPRAVNIHLSFEEALKLHLGLTQILGHLNAYNRSTTAGRRAGVNLCLFPGVKHITINEGRVGEGRSHHDAS